jgi:hypothetical protein
MWSVPKIENIEQIEDTDPILYLKRAHHDIRNNIDISALHTEINKAIKYSNTDIRDDVLEIQQFIASQRLDEAKQKLNELIRNNASDSITFEDKNLEAVIRDKINLPKGNILISDVEDITSIDASNKSIYSLKGIKYFRSLRELDLSSNNLIDPSITDFIPDAHLGLINTLKASYNISRLIPAFEELSQLRNLEVLNMSMNLISNIDMLKDLGNIRQLNLSYCNFIKDLTPLNELVLIETLELRKNMIDNVEALDKMVNLKTLDLSNNRIKDITTLEALSNLELLYLGNSMTFSDKFVCYNQITDIKALSTLPKLRVLDVEGNPVQNIKLLKENKSLKKISFQSKTVEDVSEFSGFYFNFKEMYTKEMGCFLSLLIVIVLGAICVQLKPMFIIPAFIFSGAFFFLWEGYRTEDIDAIVRGWIFGGISLILLFVI